MDAKDWNFGFQLGFGLEQNFDIKQIPIWKTNFDDLCEIGRSKSMPQFILSNGVAKLLEVVRQPPLPPAKLYM